jgi:hypothetical protein
MSLHLRGKSRNWSKKWVLSATRSELMLKILTEQKEKSIEKVRKETRKDPKKALWGGVTTSGI